MNTEEFAGIKTMKGALQNVCHSERKRRVFPKSLQKPSIERSFVTGQVRNVTRFSRVGMFLRVFAICGLCHHRRGAPAGSEAARRRFSPLKYQYPDSNAGQRLEGTQQRGLRPQKKTPIWNRARSITIAVDSMYPHFEPKQLYTITDKNPPGMYNVSGGLVCLWFCYIT